MSHVGDFDGDGYADFAVADNFDNFLLIYGRPNDYDLNSDNYFRSVESLDGNHFLVHRLCCILCVLDATATSRDKILIKGCANPAPARDPNGDSFADILCFNGTWLSFKPNATPVRMSSWSSLKSK